MAKRIPKKRADECGSPHAEADDEEPSPGEATFCDVCGRESDELKAGRCPKCFAKVIKELHSARGLGGF